jgi:hypothetical protein
MKASVRPHSLRRIFQATRTADRPIGGFHCCRFSSNSSVASTTTFRAEPSLAFTASPTQHDKAASATHINTENKERNEILSLLQGPVGSWDTPRWRRFCDMLREQSATHANVLTALPVLERMSRERPHSVEASELINTILKQTIESRQAGQQFDKNDLRKVYECVLACFEHGWRPNLRTFLHLLDLAVLFDPVDPEQADFWLAKMWEHHELNPLILPNRFNYAKLVQTWLKSGRDDAPERIQALVEGCRDRYRKSSKEMAIFLKPTEEYVYHVLCVCVRACVRLLTLIY